MYYLVAAIFFVIFQYEKPSLLENSREEILFLYNIVSTK